MSDIRPHRYAPILTRSFPLFYNKRWGGVDNGKIEYSSWDKDGSQG